MLQKLAQMVFKVIRWRIVGNLPPLDKYVIIAAPHTSNFDVLIGLLARAALATRIVFLAKHQLFIFPFGWILHKIGAIPVERSHHHNLVDQVVKMYAENEHFVLGLAPEGTRSPVKRWKQGFYHIAIQAGVPIVMVGFDYSSKEVRVSKLFEPSGDINKDFPKILDHFKTMNGRFPKKIPSFEQ